MVDLSKLSLGAIGGPETFAGQSTSRLRELYPGLTEPIYFDSSSAMFAALTNKDLDAVVGANATLGEGYTIVPRIIAERGSPLYVLIEAALPFNCSLLARKGVKLADVALIHGGPGSITQARKFIAVNMPRASTRIYDEPFATARKIAQGDENGAMLGTRSLAERFALEVLAENIDGGAVNGSWWVISRHPLFESKPTVLFVAGRFADTGNLGNVVRAIGEKGYELSGVSSYASGARLLEFDYLLRFRGAGLLKPVQEALTDFQEVRLAGAIVS